MACLNQCLAPYQKSMVNRISQAFELAERDDSLFGVLVVGTPGLGISTCINEFVKTAYKRSITIHSVDLAQGLSLSEWLGLTFGFDSVSKSLKVRVSPPLIKVIEIACIEILIMEDAHDLNIFNRPITMLDRTIQEFGELKEKIPKIKLVMTINALEMSGDFFSEKNICKNFIVVDAIPFALDDLNFLWGSSHLNLTCGHCFPSLSSRVLKCVDQFSMGSVGRALFIMGLIKQASFRQVLIAGDECVIKFISTIEGASHGRTISRRDIQ